MKEVLKLLPKAVREALERQPRAVFEKITEIRLRAAKAVVLRVGGRLRYLEKDALGFSPSVRTLYITADDVEECFLRCCKNSVYTHENEIAEGYISLSFGGRAGLSGEVITRGDGSRWYRRITGLNIRIAHQIDGCAAAVLGKVSGGVLIFGAPHTGKTTLLRDYVKSCSDLLETVALIDCRGELSGTTNGVCTLGVGENTDVITGGTKSDGIEVALRTLAPDLIAFDELGDISELEAVRCCMNAGVRIVTTFHAGSVQELLERNKALPILETGAFSYAVMLNKDFSQKIFRVEELYAEADRCDYNNRGRNPFGGTASGGNAAKRESYIGAVSVYGRDA